MARVALQVYEVNKKLLQEHAAPLMAIYLHGVAVVREELNMDVYKKLVKGERHCQVTLLSGYAAYNQEQLVSDPVSMQARTTVLWRNCSTHVVLWQA